MVITIYSFYDKVDLGFSQVLGIMGALDPHVHKRNQQSLPGSHGDVTRNASDSGQLIQSVDDLPMDLWPSFATSEDYYSTVEQLYDIRNSIIWLYV